MMSSEQSETEITVVYICTINWNQTFVIEQSIQSVWLRPTFKRNVMTCFFLQTKP